MEIDELLEHALSLTSDHLSHAASLLRTTRELTISPPNAWSWIVAKWQAMSSILHGYCGLESALNLIGYNLFFDTSSPKYVSPAQRDVPLRRLIKSWGTTLPATDKLRYILAISGKTLPSRLESEIGELNTLRNWIAHGFPFKRTLLLEQQPSGTFLEADREDSVDWQSRFTNTKFNPPDELEYQDAHTALRIVLDCMKQLHAADAKTLFWIVPYWKGPDFKLITDDFDVTDFLKGGEVDGV
jgi:hypothetical protein